MARVMSFEVRDGKVVLGGREVAEGEVVGCGLGSFEFREGRITRRSNSGAVQYSTPLRPDGQWKAGPAYAHRVKPATEEVDPIKRVLREMGIDIGKLRLAVAGKPFVATKRWYDNGHCPNGRPTHHWVHDGIEGEWNRTETESPSGYFTGGGHGSCPVEGATYALRIDGGKTMTGIHWQDIGQVIVWPNCQPDVLGDALAREKLGRWADYAFFRGQDDPEFAAGWIARQGYKFTPKPHEGYGEPEPLVEARAGGAMMGFEEVFTVEGEPVKPWTRLSPLATLVRKHGVGLIAPYLEEARAYFVRYASFGHAVAEGVFEVKSELLASEEELERGKRNAYPLYSTDYGMEGHSHLGEMVALQHLDVRAGEETARIDVVIWRSGEAYRGNVYWDRWNPSSKDFPRDGLRRALGIESRKALYVELLRSAGLDVELTPIRN